ncbi:MAG: WecB/TagA/CpsF family glycosyltransferase [Candidatus Hydrogenedentes bacterium]|nr:WecB/TagA/CpsF family glycosyltransferase [Candidatus Hydrogenedentota bacterium]
MKFSSVSLDEVFRAVTRQIEAREPGYIVTPNVDHVCEYQINEAFRRAYQNAFLVLADGVPVIWASRLCGSPIKEKISGSDLVYLLSEYAALKGYSIFFLGAEPGVAARAAEILRQRFPGFTIAGAYSPPFGFEKDPEEERKTVAMIRDAAPDICYVALGSPKGDVWNYRQCENTGVPVHVGVGASLDFVVGKVRRAPRWMQRTGLEWTWRLALEPRRLATRYLVKDLRFLPLLLREFVRCFGKGRANA